MDNLKRFDTHCHLFNINFVFEEVIGMAIYYAFTSILGESENANEEQTSQGCLDEISKWLKKVIDYFIIIEGDPLTQYSLIQAAYETKTHNKDKICVVPLMMDIFYMFDGVLNRRHSGDKDSDCYNISKEQADKIIRDEMKKYISEKNDILSEEQINQYLNTIESIDLSKEQADKIIRDEMKKYISEKNDILSEEQINQYLNAIESIDLNKKPESDEFRFTFMSLGYLNQFFSMLVMKIIYPKTVYPFLAFDPRRPGIMNLVEACVGKNKPFAGIKLYTRLGYHPNSKGMQPLYKYCKDNELPIIVHTSDGGFPPGDDWKYRYYSDPKEWIDVLNEKPDLRIDFAHFGDGNPAWTKQIADFMSIYPNVYADVSCFTDKESLETAFEYLNSEKYPKVRERLMFGTDYIMVRMWKSLPEYFGQFIEKFGSETLDMLMTNSNKFLNL